MVCLGRPYHFKFFKGSLSQILFSPFLNTLTQLEVWEKWRFPQIWKINHKIAKATCTEYAKLKAMNGF